MVRTIIPYAIRGRWKWRSRGRVGGGDICHRFYLDDICRRFLSRRRNLLNRTRCLAYNSFYLLIPYLGWAKVKLKCSHQKFAEG
jgi:hypothetical protein